MNEPDEIQTTDIESSQDQPRGFDLKTAYEILIRAYVRNHLTHANTGEDEP